MDIVSGHRYQVTGHLLVSHGWCGSVHYTHYNLIWNSDEVISEKMTVHAPKARFIYLFICFLRTKSQDQNRDYHRKVITYTHVSLTERAHNIVLIPVSENSAISAFFAAYPAHFFYLFIDCYYFIQWTSPFSPSFITS